MDPIRVRAVPQLPPRAADAHKGSYGKVLLIAGSSGMSGAAVLAGTAALRAGAGLVQVAVPAPVGPVVALGHPCYMTVWLPADDAGHLAAPVADVLALAKAADVVVVGPGLGQTPQVRAVVLALLAEVRQPLVLDADALNVLGAQPCELAKRRAPFVLTPHPGEFARLIGRDTKAVQADREALALAFADTHHGVLVLKGAGTVVTDGQRLYVNTTGNPGMATGGCGDVLAGLLGALLGQGLEPFDATVLAVYLHGLAGDLARDALGEESLLATDLVAHLPAAFRRRPNAS